MSLRSFAKDCARGFGSPLKSVANCAGRMALAFFTCGAPGARKMSVKAPRHVSKAHTMVGKALLEKEPEQGIGAKMRRVQGRNTRLTQFVLGSRSNLPRICRATAAKSARQASSTASAEGAGGSSPAPAAAPGVGSAAAARAAAYLRTSGTKALVRWTSRVVSSSAGMSLKVSCAEGTELKTSRSEAGGASSPSSNAGAPPPPPSPPADDAEAADEEEAAAVRAAAASAAWKTASLGPPSSHGLGTSALWRKRRTSWDFSSRAAAATAAASESYLRISAAYDELAVVKNGRVGFRYRPSVFTAAWQQQRVRIQRLSDQQTAHPSSSGGGTEWMSVRRCSTRTEESPRGTAPPLALPSLTCGLWWLNGVGEEVQGTCNSEVMVRLRRLEHVRW